jgi:RHS repeat-associated protein
LSQNGTTIQTIGYTADGNTNSFSPGIMSPGGQRITGLAYNQAAQLAAVMSGSESLAQYAYDGFGQRLVKTLNGSTAALYQNDLAGLLLEETDAHGSPQADYIYLNGTPIATISPATEKVYFLHDERLGTPQLATDSGQNSAWSSTYLPFGGTSSVQGLITQNLRLPGQQFDSESGWNHNGFRDYAQGWGRYLQPDPIGLVGGLNFYRYAGSNPPRYTDPLGLLSWSDLRLPLIRLIVALTGQWLEPNPDDYQEGPTTIEEQVAENAVEDAASQVAGQTTSCPLDTPPPPSTLPPPPAPTTPPFIRFFMSTPPSVPWFFIWIPGEFDWLLNNFGGGGGPQTT